MERYRAPLRFLAVLEILPTGSNKQTANLEFWNCFQKKNSKSTFYEFHYVKEYNIVKLSLNYEK